MSVTVAAENGAGWDAYCLKATHAVSDARILLDNMMRALEKGKPSKDVVRYAHRYFLTGEKELSQDDLRRLLVVMTLTKNGLNLENTIKVGTDPTSRGQITGNRINGAPKPSHQEYHNVVANLVTGVEWPRGAIHITPCRLEQGRLGVKALVHEATHKYSGTIDYSCFEDDGARPRGTFDDKAKALLNADSYAWFALKVGRGGMWSAMSGKFNFNSFMLRGGS